MDDCWHRIDLGDCTFTVPRRYQNLQLIGPHARGGQGVVCRAHDTVMGRDVAIKKLNRPFENPTSAKRACREMELMDIMQHKNVVSLLNAFTPQKTIESFEDIYFVMEYMEATLDKIDLTKLDHERFSWLLYQMFRGVKALHTAGIIHRDLKPENIGVKSDCTLKILDLGLARSITLGFSMTNYVVTRYYRAPEVILGLPYGENVDIWSIGCIMGQMIRKNEILFCGLDHVDQWVQVASKLGSPGPNVLDKLTPDVRRAVERYGPYQAVPMEELFPDALFPPTQDEWNADSARDLLRRMLKIDPDERISVDDAMTHPYVNRWYDPDAETYHPRRFPYNNELETFQTAPEFKRYIFDRLMLYEQAFDIFEGRVSIPEDMEEFEGEDMDDDSEN